MSYRGSGRIRYFVVLVRLPRLGFGYNVMCLHDNFMVESQLTASCLDQQLNLKTASAR